jgi:hypothetical protein
MLGSLISGVRLPFDPQSSILEYDSRQRFVELPRKSCLDSFLVTLKMSNKFSTRLEIAYLPNFF